MNEQLAKLSSQRALTAVAVALHDCATGRVYGWNADRWFHAASTVKVALLLALAAAVDARRFRLDWRLAVRNRFLSAADGAPFRVAASRDADGAVHAHLGRTLTIAELARHMIATSSNLATNLLLDLVTVGYARDVLARAGIGGVELRRGVEDERAFSEGINNRVTAEGLVALFTCIDRGRVTSPEMTSWMRDVLLQQQFKSGIPAGLPQEVRANARIAHKTGEISTIAHDAGMVYLPDGTAYAVALLTETDGERAPSMQDVAALSRVAYDHVMAMREAAADDRG